MSKIDEQIKELQARKKSIEEVTEVKKSLGKMISDKKLQEKIMHFIGDIKTHLENGLTIDDIAEKEELRATQFTEQEEEVLKALVKKALNKKAPVKKEAPASSNNAIVDALQLSENTTPQAKPTPKNATTSSGLGDLDPIRFHQSMHARMGCLVTNLQGKELGTLKNQDYPNLIIQKNDGNTISMHANRVYVANPKEFRNG